MKFTATLIMLTMLVSTSFAQTARTIRLAGLVVNAENLSPVENAGIYDDAGHLLGTSDSNGYYKVSLSYTAAGDVKFALKIAKDGFQTFTQRERWGDIANPGNIMNFGLAKKGAHKKAFSTLGSETGTHEQSYENVLKNFNQYKEKKNL